MTVTPPSFSYTEFATTVATPDSIPAPRFSDESHCGGCDRPMTRSQAEYDARPDDSDLRRHVARGMCGSCYHGSNRDGTRARHRSTQSDHEWLIKIFVAERKLHPTISQQKVADKLGVNRSTLAMALGAALKRKDARLTRNIQNRVDITKKES
jgi:hypothetical protein